MPMRRGHFGRVTSLALVLLIASLGTLQITSASAASPASARQAPARPQKPDIFTPGPANHTSVGKPGGPTVSKTMGGAVEVPSLRTRTSSTLVGRGGYELVSYPGSVHFRDTAGTWQDIDDTLIKSHADGYAYQNRANSYTAFFPSTLGSYPVKFQLGSAWVGFGLVGASASVAVAGNTAAYAGALPSVSVQYASLNDELKENLILASPDESSFTFDLTTSAGLTAEPGALGSIDFVDRSGKAAFGFLPPFMVDASGARSSAIGVQLVTDRGAQALVLSPDMAWLHNPARDFPVTIDPTVTISYSGSSIIKTYTGANQDCYIVSSSPTTSFCNGRSLLVGYSSPAINRGLLQFNVSIPQDANILEADLAMDLSGTMSSSAQSVSLYPVTSAWTTAASWNTRDGTNSWTAAGGDYSTPAAWTNTAVGPSTGWYHWYLSSVVQGDRKSGRVGKECRSRWSP